MEDVLVLEQEEWRALEEAHVEKVRPWTRAYQERRSRGEKHPVHDFLFQYYSFRPAHLERWHPGPGVALAGPEAKRFLERPEYREDDEGVVLDEAAFTPKRADTTRYFLHLLESTASRAPRLSCFGLHEWAMVYRQTPEQVRHNQLPLRLGSAGTDDVVEALEIRCGHYDAYRFFTEPARQRNSLQPTRATQPALEQPGCLHANMDLYKISYKLSPFVPAELIADCFALAAEIRELDMRASPYDLTALGYPPVPIETPAGRAEYAHAQGEFARRAAPLRDRLVSFCHTSLAMRTDS
ncbi:3-methyladenine DNA glycosylase [Amycolatopsis acidicola]|uniref:3-methyladenine DNA glycosylase n=1 Tax=Amycolatopsis acidicola TaxID=2596893 RepID=A0A5N0UKB4_9PSEU|nr:3-methyladenine DNA glycosylase [Amycolatopsis acidicola]KAA9147869.1 3-methyladenine DNA glycosylase [Amycolatopsis acidicola]